MLTRDLEHIVEHLRVIEHAGGVVRIDDEHRAGAAGDLAAQVLNVRVPAGLLVTAVIHGRRAAQADGVGPERVVRRGDEHLVAGIEQRQERKIHHLAHAVADEHILRLHVLDTLFDAVIDNGLARGGHALKITVGNGLLRAAFERPADAFRQREAKRRGIAGIELHHVHALLGELQRFAIERTADIRMDMLHSLGELDHENLPHMHTKCLYSRNYNDAIVS